MNKKAFSLVELIVGISISIILMTSVGIFVNNGMQSLFYGQNSLKNTSNLNYFANKIYEDFEYMNSGSIAPTGSGIVFQRDKNYSDGGFTYIGTHTKDGFYCEENESESKITNHIFKKDFIPFIEKDENINSDFDKILTSTGISLNSKTYKSIQKEHKVIDETGNIIIGKGIFGSKFEEGSEARNIYLNSPTGLASDGEVLYISDTLNNRVLYMTGSKVYSLLDEKDGLKEPTGLLYDNTDNSLYISNSGKGEILKLSSENISNPELNISFSENINNINKIKIFFYKDGNIKNINSISESDFTFSGINKDDDFLNIVSNNLEYLFLDYNSETSTSFCDGTNNGENYNFGNPINCISFGTGQLSSPTYKNISSGDSIKIENISLENMTESGNYYVNVKLFEDSSERYSKYFKFFTNGDGKIYTKNDNILEVFESGKNYPNGIWKDGSDIKYNEFETSSLTNINFNEKYDYILKTPVKNLKIEKTTDDMLFLNLKYYQNYNCFNLNENEGKIKTFLINKNLK